MTVIVVLRPGDGADVYLRRDQSVSVEVHLRPDAETGSVYLRGKGPIPQPITEESPAPAEITASVGDGEVLVVGNAATVGVEIIASAGAGEVLVTGNAATVGIEITAAAGSGEVLVEGDAVTLALSGQVVAIQERRDTHGSGGYDDRRHTRKQEQQLLAILQAWLDEAA